MNSKAELESKLKKLNDRKAQLQQELTTTQSMVAQETANLGAAMLNRSPAAEGIGTRIASLRVVGEEGVQAAIEQADREIEQLNLLLERVEDETQKALEEFELIYPQEVESFNQAHAAFKAYFEYVKSNRSLKASLIARLGKGGAHSQEIALREIVFASDILIEGMVDKLNLFQAIDTKIGAYADSTTEKPAPQAAKPRGATRKAKEAV